MPFRHRRTVDAGPFRFSVSENDGRLETTASGPRVGSAPDLCHIRMTAKGASFLVQEGKGASHSDAKETSDPFKALHALAARRRARPSAAMIGAAIVAFLAVFMSFFSDVGGILLFLLVYPAWRVGCWIDGCRRLLVLFYDFDERPEKAYQSFIDAFDRLEECSAVRMVELESVVQDMATWKRHAGAANLLRKEKATLDYRLPWGMGSNLLPPALQLGTKTLFFFPDLILVEEGQRQHAVPYAELKLSSHETEFIEEGEVPPDAQVIDHVWKHPNKRGGPDRRFRENYKIPVCRYEVMRLRLASDLDVRVEFSRVGPVYVFMQALRGVADYARHRSAADVGPVREEAQKKAPSPQGKRA